MMNEIPKNPGEVDSVTEEAQEFCGDAASVESGHAESKPQPARRPWKKIALVVGGVLVTAATAAMVTLVATRRSAVMMNARAYANGLVDGYKAHGNDFGENDPFEYDDRDDDDDEYCPSCNGLEGMQYCPECHRIDSFA